MCLHVLQEESGVATAVPLPLLLLLLLLLMDEYCTRCSPPAVLRKEQQWHPYDAVLPVCRIYTKSVLLVIASYSNATP